MTLSGVTIVAVATGPASGGIGIIRLSGPAALAAARSVTGGAPREVVPRHAHLVSVTLDGVVVDEGVLLFFAGPRSYTGEDVVELQLHGAPRLLQLVVQHLARYPGVRLAEPGEFTRRAFMSGRLPLSRAEAVASLIAAESEAQVRAAAAQLAGALSMRVSAVQKLVTDLRADVEGVLDFPDEADGAEVGLGDRLKAAKHALAALLREARQGSAVRRGARVVLYGPVNAGKSTLFNALLGDARAIVDPEPGTTRDTLEARLELGGLAVTLVDTAGLRDGAGRLEALGIERTRAALRGADLAVLVVPVGVARDEWAREVSDDLRIDVLSKADSMQTTDSPALALSGLTGAGLERLRETLVARLGGTAGGVFAASERHVECLSRADEALARAGEAFEVETLEVVGGELGLAAHALGEIDGADVGAQLLDEIFARFCIGK